MCSLRRVLRNGSCSNCPLLLMMASLLWFLGGTTCVGLILYSSFWFYTIGLPPRGGSLSIRIGSAPELDAQGCALQFESVPEKTFQIAAIALRNIVERVAVDDDTRRVSTALMGVAQLRAAIA